MISRWTSKKKRELLVAIERQEVTIDEVGVSADEIESWTRLYQQYGLKGLRTTHLQRYRERLAR